ncbi:hypothetical protein EVG20_g6744 [Dentipellis fragilis]|uniref:Uncharacterized protein n=1 Tax=Dentipellis fragilis TaxID=205917 RepID=A0A4Y9YJL9_9AGAM|nr:hypothetical protein EVG20_g6744 [Dentipellis fragilis]
MSDRKLREVEEDYFLQWLQLHAISIRKAAIATVLTNMDCFPNFPDLTGWMFGVDLRPRLVHSGDFDPSTAFCVRDVRLYHAHGQRQEWVKHAGLVREDSSWVTADEWLQWAEVNGATDRLITIIPIGIMYHDIMKMESAPMFVPSREAQAALVLRLLEPVDYLRRWIPTFKAMVLRGHVLGPPDVEPDDDVGLEVGRVIKLGNRWGWVSLTDEEVQQAGYIKYPGVVGSIMQVST